MVDKTTPLMPHKVLSDKSVNGLPVGLTFTENQFAGIVFRYNNVKFNEDKDNDVLKVQFDYTVLDVPEALVDYDKNTFEKIVSEFGLQLLYYGLERDHLGMMPDDQSNDFS
jgi:hypothetical protein